MEGRGEKDSDAVGLREGAGHEVVEAGLGAVAHRASAGPGP